VSLGFAELAIDFVEPTSVEQSVKNVGSVAVVFDMVGLVEEVLMG
jgi:hypothetical protein